MGLFGQALPEEYGGLGVTMAEDVELAVEFGSTTPVLRSLFRPDNGIAGQVIARFGSDEQKRRTCRGGPKAGADRRHARRAADRRWAAA
jgi:acyl-CoA dehydrogenase